MEFALVVVVVSKLNTEVTVPEKLICYIRCYTRCQPWSSDRFSREKLVVYIQANEPQVLDDFLKNLLKGNGQQTSHTFFSSLISFLLTWMLEYWNTSLSTTMTLEDSNDIPPSSLKPPILKQQPHHLLTSGYQQNIKKYKLSTFEPFHHKMADALTTSSRSFYERSKAKLGLSIVLGAASMMLLGFSSGSGGLVSYCQPRLSFHWPLGSVNVFMIKAFLHIRLECI